MFQGSSPHTIDAKGRIIIPARFRQLIKSDTADGVMVTGMDDCLLAYPFESWRELVRKIKGMSAMSEEMRRFRRIFIGGASECTCDKQERILIPPFLRQYAEFKKNIVLVGVLDHFEIWSRANLEREHLRLGQDMQKEGLRNEIASLGI